MRAFEAKFALGTGIGMSLVLFSAVATPVAVFLGAISTDFADVVLTADLVFITAGYTLATYGRWWESSE
jgi:hypothetical protein